MNKPTVTIGIAAYAAEQNIEHILRAVLGQEQSNFILKTVIVHQDEYPDQTIARTKAVNDNRVKIIETKPRQGFSKAVKRLLEASDADITILLNDDIRIFDRHLIEKLIDPFYIVPSLGLVSANPRPLAPQTFVERAIISSAQAWEKTRYQVNNGHNPNACDGKVLVFSKHLKDALLAKETFDNMANVDGYVYLFNKEQGFAFRHIREAQVSFRNPQTIKDYLKWFIRNNAQRPVLQSRFGELCLKEFRLPRGLLLYNCFIQALKNPLGALFLLSTRFYIAWQVNKYKKNFTPTWDLVDSSKRV